MGETEFHTDFHRDWTEHLKKELKNMGYDISDIVDTNIPMAYFNAYYRRIPCRKRTVVRSNEFTCPNEHLEGINLIESKARRGEDLNPHLKKEVMLEAEGTDAMLFDWGVNHFHLGTTEKRPGLMKRTGPLLFAIISDTHFYLIDVKKHGDWSDQEIIQIIRNNWPEIIKPHTLTGVSDVVHESTNEEIQILRHARINPIIKAGNGSIISSPGGGLTTNGKSIKVTRKVIAMTRYIRTIENSLKKQKNTIIKQLEAIDNNIPNRIHFKLIIEGDKYYAKCNKPCLKVKF